MPCSDAWTEGSAIARIPLNCLSPSVWHEMPISPRPCLMNGVHNFTRMTAKADARHVRKVRKQRRLRMALNRVTENYFSVLTATAAAAGFDGSHKAILRASA